MSPAERKNWAESKPGSAKQSAAYKEIAKNTKKFGSTKPLRVVDTPVTKGGELEKKLKAEKAATTKRPTLADLKKNEAKGLEEAKARVAAKNKALANSAKGKTQTPQAVEAKKKAAANPEGPKGGKNTKPKFRKIKAAGKGGVVGAVAGEVISLGKGSTKKDFNEINRLEQKLADITGKGKSKATAGRQGAQQQLSQLASLASLGVVGKTRRQRMDELNALIAKAEKKNKPKELRYGKDGSSLVPGTAAYKAGSKTKPAYGTTPTGGGSTSKTDSRYTVKRGDNLYNIAKTAGLTLAEIRAANPEIMKKKKYKQGAMIWAGTKVNIPKKK